MLRFLGVRHLAVIDRLEVEFEPGLNLLTGETGAGKSVLVEAIDLLIGGRASADLVRTGEASASVQAVFERPGGPEVIVRREVSSQGRSRAFIDDALATTAALRELGADLIDLHGQHEHQTLLDPAEHVRLLDAMLPDATLVARVADDYRAWRAAAAALDRLRLDDREKQARLELVSFQLQALDKAMPVEGEDEALAAERTILANADRLQRLAREAYGALYDGEHAALSALAIVWKRVADLAALDARFAPHLDARDMVKPPLDDLAFTLRTYASGFDESPERLQAVEDRLAVLERLKRTYGPTLADVRRRHRELREERDLLDAGEDRVRSLTDAEREAQSRFVRSASLLSDARTTAAAALGRSLEAALGDLAMPHSRVEIRVVPEPQSGEWSDRGTDRVEFLLSPNPGEDLRPLARIASGGELSRIMLALRSLVAAPSAGRTLVFDEVDAGIGGAGADAVGERLQRLARTHQVLCITHLPQIAARPGAHLHLSKVVRGGRTSTELVRLDPAAREHEIARMIAGAQVAPQVLASARELLAARAGESESKAKGESEGSAGRAARSKGLRGAS